MFVSAYQGEDDYALRRQNKKTAKKPEKRKIRANFF